MKTKFIQFVINVIERIVDFLETLIDDKQALDVEPSLVNDDSTSNEEKVEVVTRDENYGKATSIRYERGGLDKDHPVVEYLLVEGKPIKSTTYSHRVRVVPDGDEYIAA